MANKAKVTKEMIVAEGLELIRENGEEKLNVRNLAARLGCSTQPVMYCYPTVGKLRKDILEKANEFHTAFLTQGLIPGVDIIIGIGINYIRFAEEERNLFRFIFLSDEAQSSGIAELITSDESRELLRPVIDSRRISESDAGDILEALFAAFHGYAMLIAYNMMPYDKRQCKKQLERIYRGVISGIYEENRQITMSF